MKFGDYFLFSGFNNEIWLWSAFGCGLFFVLRSFGRIDEFALVAAGNTFIMVAAVTGTTLSTRRIGIRVLVYIYLLIGLDFCVFPNVF